MTKDTSTIVNTWPVPCDISKVLLKRADKMFFEKYGRRATRLRLSIFQCDEYAMRLFGELSGVHLFIEKDWGDQEWALGDDEVLGFGSHG